MNSSKLFQHSWFKKTQIKQKQHIPPEFEDL